MPQKITSGTSAGPTSHRKYHLRRTTIPSLTPRPNHPRNNRPLLPMCQKPQRPSARLSQAFTVPEPRRIAPHRVPYKPSTKVSWSMSDRKMEALGGPLDEPRDTRIINYQFTPINPMPPSSLRCIPPGIHLTSQNQTRYPDTLMPVVSVPRVTLRCRAQVSSP
jgi:hypothetical protein